MKGKKELEELIASQAEITVPIQHNLVAVICVYETEEDGDVEVYAAVGRRFAKDFFKMDDRELSNFLENEYTSEDSQALIEHAILKKQLQVCKVL